MSNGASDATIGSIYDFFPGGKKEALAAEVVRTTGGGYRDLFVAIAEEAANPVQALADFFAGAAVLEDSGYIDPCPIGGIAREVANTSEALRIAAADTFQLRIDAAHKYLRSAGALDAAASELAALFVATVDGTFVVSRTQRSPDALLAAGNTSANSHAKRSSPANRKPQATRPLRARPRTIGSQQPTER